MLKLLDITVKFHRIVSITTDVYTKFCEDWSHGSEVDRVRYKARLPHMPTFFS